MAGMTGREIYDNFQDGRGPDGLSSAAAIVNELAAESIEEGDVIRRLVAKMESVWEGDAAGAAQRGAGPLVTEHEMSAAAMDIAQDLTNRQAGSYSDAKNAVVPVPPKPEPANPLVALTSPGALVSYEQQVDEYNDATQHNVDVMDRYTGATRYNVDGTPLSYGSITDDQAGIGAGPTGTADEANVADTDPGIDDAGGRDATPGPGGGGPGRSDSDGGKSAPVGDSPNTAAQGAATSPEQFSPSSALPVAPIVPGTDGGAGRPVGGPASGVGVVAGPGFGIPNEPGAGTRGGGGGPGGVARGPGAGPHGTAGRPGQAAGGVAGAAGRGGPGLGGMPVGARARDGEDTERKRPEYLEGEDPTELFDSDVMTVPPAIGDEDDAVSPPSPRRS